MVIEQPFVKKKKKKKVTGEDVPFFRICKARMLGKKI